MAPSVVYGASMPDRSRKRPTDLNSLAASIVADSTDGDKPGLDTPAPTDCLPTRRRAAPGSSSSACPQSPCLLRSVRVEQYNRTHDRIHGHSVQSTVPGRPGRLGGGAREAVRGG